MDDALGVSPEKTLEKTAVILWMITSDYKEFIVRFPFLSLIGQWIVLQTIISAYITHKEVQKILLGEMASDVSI